MSFLRRGRSMQDAAIRNSETDCHARTARVSSIRILGVSTCPAWSYGVVSSPFLSPPLARFISLPTGTVGIGIQVTSRQRETWRETQNPSMYHQILLPVRSGFREPTSPRIQTIKRISSFMSHIELCIIIIVRYVGSRSNRLQNLLVRPNASVQYLRHVFRVPLRNERP